MTAFRGKQKCNRCGKEYDWFGYKLDKNEAFISTAVTHHFVDAFKDGAGQWHVMVHCDCGNRDEADSFAIG